LAYEISIDLGTANIVIVDNKNGVVLDEPSVIAYQVKNGQKRLLAVGDDAKLMLGKTPESILAIRPLSGGVIADFDAAQDMISAFFKKALNNFAFRKPVVFVCVPYGATPVEKRAIKASIEAAGGRRVGLVEEPMAAALGAGMPVLEPTGSMIVDIGGGTTEVAVLSLGGIVVAQSIRVGGDHFDEAIAAFLKKKYNLNVGLATCEMLKFEIGTATHPNDGVGRKTKVRGRHGVSGLPEEIEVTQADMAEALRPLVTNICEAVMLLLEQTPPDLAGDIQEHGLVLTGGGAGLTGIDKALSDTTNLPAVVANNHKYCVAFGTQIAMNLGRRIEHAIQRDP
jgi:rod shape-determining protein MreB